jgi:TetR/AcrR family transcriptional regulator
MTMSTVERRERDKNRRRDEILQSAEQVFAEKGFEAAGMAEIARRADLSKGAVYLYFRGKDDLAFALFERETRRLLLVFQQETAAFPRGIDKIRALSRAFLLFYRDNSSSYIRKNFGFFFNSAHMANPSARASAENLKEIFSLIIAILSAGLRDGSIRADIDPIKTAHIYGNLVLSYLVRINTGYDLSIPGSELPPEELLDYTFNLVFRLIEK